jgi:hypothetical protein
MSIRKVAARSACALVFISVLFSASAAPAQESVARLTPPAGSRHSWFGYSLAADATTLVVGDPEYRKDSTSQFCPIGYGAIQIYKKSGSSWSLTPAQTFLHDSGSAENKFGKILSLGGNLLVVSSEREVYTSGGTTVNDAGAFVVYRRTSTTANFSRVAKVYAPTPTQGARFTQVTGAVTNGTYVAAGVSPASPDVHVYQVQQSSVPRLYTITLPFSVPYRLFITSANVLVVLPAPGSFSRPFAYQLSGSTATSIDTSALSDSAFSVSDAMAGDGNTVVFTKRRTSAPLYYVLQIVRFSGGTIASSEVRDIPASYRERSPSTLNSGLAIRENQGFLLGYSSTEPFVYAYKYAGGTYNQAGTIRLGYHLSFPFSYRFAESVAFNGTEMFVGDSQVIQTSSGSNPCTEPGSQGAVNILRPLATTATGPGTSTKLQPWLHSAVLSMGQVVAANGSYIAAGSNNDGDGPENYGQVTLYQNVSGTWQQVERYVDGYSTSGWTGFGSSVDISDNFLVIGATEANSQASPTRRTGVVHIAPKIGNQYAHGPGLTVLSPEADTAEGSYFGASVALSGNTLVAGAPSTGLPSGTTANRGWVNVHDWNGSSWPRFARLTPTVSSGNSYEAFGQAVAVYGSYVLVGIPQRNNAGRFRVGAVQFFRRTTTGYVSAGEFNAPSGLTADANFGNAVTIGADYAAAGTPSMGTVVVYRRSGTSWLVDTTLAPGQAYFGRSISLQGTRLIVGSPWANNQIYRYERGTSSWTNTGTLTGFSGFGLAVDLAGDLVAVGNPDVQTGGAYTGAAYAVGFGF